MSASFDEIQPCTLEAGTCRMTSASKVCVFAAISNQDVEYESGLATGLRKSSGQICGYWFCRLGPRQKGSSHCSGGILIVCRVSEQWN
ncbi:hypothetical protein FVE85_6956 [Porphyridium purpureum]|uniref:Uncharacterized protein n=1 Tax=Porphyridium purpureum TaxID=35688 RepID=A0A5J4Z683_PORPP|nr:hypothetical protein FVE85_6956 [Porphyridium purpureum]|eukprot:POR5060..scf295_1